MQSAEELKIWNVISSSLILRTQHNSCARLTLKETNAKSHKDPRKGSLVEGFAGRDPSSVPGYFVDNVV